MTPLMQAFASSHKLQKAFRGNVIKIFLMAVSLPIHENAILQNLSDSKTTANEKL